MRTTQAVLALVLTMSFVVAVSTAQVVTEEPAVTTKKCKWNGKSDNRKCWLCRFRTLS